MPETIEIHGLRFWRWPDGMWRCKLTDEQVEAMWQSDTAVDVAAMRQCDTAVAKNG